MSAPDTSISEKYAGFYLTITGTRIGAYTWVPRIDWSKYLGVHYEIGHSKNWFTKKGSFDITATYSPGDNENEIKILNKAKYYNLFGNLVEDHAEGRAVKVFSSNQEKGDKPFPDTNKLEVYFGSTKGIKGSYLVADYIEGLYSVVVSENHDYIWILSRKPWLEPKELAFIETRVNKFIQLILKRGYDLNALIFTGQDTLIVDEEKVKYFNRKNDDFEKFKEQTILWNAILSIPDGENYNYTNLFTVLRTTQIDVLKVPNPDPKLSSIANQTLQEIQKFKPLYTLLLFSK